MPNPIQWKQFAGEMRKRAVNIHSLLIVYLNCQNKDAKNIAIIWPSTFLTHT